MQIEDFIDGLRRQNSEALGFIPYRSLVSQYINTGRHLIQYRDGRPIGYLLHGVIKPGELLVVTQACIEFDLRYSGYGHDVVNRLIDRARLYNVREIKLNCAENLPANLFWQSYGFELTKTIVRHNRRQRAINTYILPLWPRLIG